MKERSPETAIRIDEAYLDLTGTERFVLAMGHFRRPLGSSWRAVTALRTVPTAAMRQGNFAGTGATIYDPATGALSVNVAGGPIDIALGRPGQPGGAEGRVIGQATAIEGQ